MPPKKAAKPNGFVLFAQELQRQHGRKYPSLKDACDAAAPLWARMSKEDKQPYDNRAKQMKGESHSTRYTSEGLDVQQLTKDEQLKKQAEEQAREAIRNIVTVAYKKEALDTEVFFLIHCNIFCHYQNEDRYWPAEIAVIAFNLKDGFKPENIFHFMVNPGPLPIGYKFDAKKHSDETHLITVPYDDDVETNTEYIYFELKAFLEKKKPAGMKSMPILYADRRHLKVARRILNLWGEKYDDQSNLFNVYELQVMFHYLRNTVAGDTIWNKMSFSERELEKDVYAYVPDIACQFHADSSKPVYCSKSIVLRYVFVICDNCCPDLGIDLIEAQHVPSNADISGSTSIRGSSMSSRSSQSGKISKRRGFDSDFETDFASDAWETDSTMSSASASTLTSTMDFPTLNKPRSVYSHGTNSLSGAAMNSSGGMSYAGATGSGLPVAFENTMSQLTLNSGRSVTPRSRGRGYPVDSDSSVSDFPPLENSRGRGHLLKNLMKNKPVGGIADNQ